MASTKTTIKCPCTPDCPDRAVGCRSSCEAFQEYDKQRMASYAERDKERQKERAMSQFESPSFRHYQYIKRMEEKNR